MTNILKLFALILCLISAPSVTAAEEQIEYIYISKRSPAMSGIENDGSFLVLGPKTYMVFNQNIVRSGGYSGPLDAKFSGPISLEGYAQYVRKNSDGNLVIAGVNYNRSFSFDDKRQNFIAIIQPKGFKVLKEKNFKERVTLGLELLGDGNFLMLAQGSGGYFKLSVLNEKLKVLNEVTFGGGPTTLSGSLAITPDGNYAVLGFEGVASNEVSPVYWEFSPKLEQIEKQILTQASKKRGNGMDVLELIKSDDALYAAYGWDTGNTKDEAPDKVHLRKIKGTGWDSDALMPYRVGMRFFNSKNGPYVLYRNVDNLEKITFDPATGKRTTKILNRPADPVECFPPRKKYDIVDIVQTEKGSDFIVLSNTPLDNHNAGCITIGEMP